MPSCSSLGPAAVTLWSSSAQSDKASHQVAQQGRVAPAHKTLCSQAGMPRNEALCQRPKAQPHTENHPNLCCSPCFSTYFYPSVLEGSNKAIMYFNAAMYFPAVEIGTRLDIEAHQHGPHSKSASWCSACTHTLSCKHEDRDAAVFPTTFFKSEVLTKRCWVLGHLSVRATFTNVH